MIKAGIIGATGYAGAEIARLLCNHPEAEVVWYGSRSYVDEKFASVYGNFFKIIDAKCMDDDMDALCDAVDVIFTATPQGYLSKILTGDILEKVKVIDLSADYRLKDVGVYEHWYKLTHGSPELISRAVYGLCELKRDEIKNTRLLANPGCYTTCSILSIYPLVKEGLIAPETIIIDAKSGTSGAGRGAKVPNLFCEVNESIKAYGVTTHRHTPEIEALLSEAANEPVTLTFTPHLVPMNRGILVTAYASLKKDASGKIPSSQAIKNAYEKYYGNEYFIRLLAENTPPETRWVEGSNFVDISFAVDERTGRVVMMGALDNLVKGAAGQAVQNMNIMFGCDETAGLAFAPMFP